MNNNFETEFDSELEKRISLIESAEYKFPKRFAVKDYVLTLVSALLCLVAIIAGGFIK